MAKHDQLRMYEFLNAAALGDLEHLRALLNQGKDVNATDYDMRSALMLASRENQEVRAHAQGGW